MYGCKCCFLFSLTNKDHREKVGQKGKFEKNFGFEINKKLNSSISVSVLIFLSLFFVMHFLLWCVILILKKFYDDSLLTELNFDFKTDLSFQLLNVFDLNNNCVSMNDRIQYIWTMLEIFHLTGFDWLLVADYVIIGYSETSL